LLRDQTPFKRCTSPATVRCHTHTLPWLANPDCRPDQGECGCPPYRPCCAVHVGVEDCGLSDLIRPTCFVCGANVISLPAQQSTNRRTLSHTHVAFIGRQWPHPRVIRIVGRIWANPRNPPCYAVDAGMADCGPSDLISPTCLGLRRKHDFVARPTSEHQTIVRINL
jgi:hypothetical protein